MAKDNDLKSAVESIKTAILQGQYEAAKEVNRVQLAVYYAIGKYLSLNTRKAKWGSGAIETISRLLRKELPGLRGFSATQMKEMRLFYEGWKMLDPNLSYATDKSQGAENEYIINSSAVADEFKNAINIHQAIMIPETKDFPVDDFFNVPFTHHTIILRKSKDIKERYYYIHRTAVEHISKEYLKKGAFKSSYLGQLMTYLSILDTKVKKPNENPSIGIVMCKSANREFVEFVIRDYNKPMGVVTYRTSEEMPEKLRKALPDVEELKKLL